MLPTVYLVIALLTFVRLAYGLWSMTRTQSFWAKIGTWIFVLLASAFWPIFLLVLLLLVSKVLLQARKLPTRPTEKKEMDLEDDLTLE